jgi:hypothetical protein
MITWEVLLQRSEKLVQSHVGIPAGSAHRQSFPGFSVVFPGFILPRAFFTPPCFWPELMLFLPYSL